MKQTRLSSARTSGALAPSIYLVIVMAVACTHAPKTPQDGSTGGSSAGASGGNGGSSSGQQGPRLTRLRVNGEPVTSVNPDPYDSWLFFDNQLEQTCAFYPTSENDMRCIPTTRGVVASVSYSDSDCKTPIIQVQHDPCGVAPTLYVSASLSSDEILNTFYPGIVTVQKKGGEIAAPAQIFKKDYDGSGCSPAQVDPQGTFYATEAVDTSAFAHATFVEQEGTGQLLKRPKITTDENLVVADFFFGVAFDVGLNTECFFQPSGTCAPYATHLVDVFTDATTCQAAAIADLSGSSAAGTLGYHNRKYYAITRTQTDVEVYGRSSSQDTCGDLGSADLYTLGSEAAPQSGVVTLVGDGRIQQKRVNADGLSWLLGYWDSQGSADCMERLGPDKNLYCVTHANTGRSVFTDAQCQHPVAETDQPDVAPAVLLTANACGSVPKVYSVIGTASLTAAPFVQTASGACVPSGETDWDQYVYITYGAEISLSTYPRIDRE